MDPIITGGLISAAASLFGGRKSQKSNEAMAREQVKLQKEFAQHGIRWKVEDAKAAGLHPLYALGAQTAQYSPVTVQDSVGASIADAGQHVGRAVAATSTASERQLAALAIEEGKSRIRSNDAQSAYYLSEAARNAQFKSPGLPHEDNHATFGTADGVQSSPTAEFAKTIVPVEGDSTLARGPTPLWRQFSLGPGLPIVLPGGMQGDAAEVLESISESWPMMFAVYKENVRRFGQRWGDKFIQRYAPFGDWWSKNLGVDRPRKFRNPKQFKKFRDNFTPYEGM